jgi:protein required for attachment to host cells
MKKEIWVLVANSSFARIYKVEKNHTLVELEVFEHPESRLHEMDLTSGKPGRVFDRFGGGRHAMEQQTSPKMNEFMIFAKQLSSHLDTARNKGTFGKLYIAASPLFLGLLRQEISSLTAELIAGEVPKDMTHVTKEEIVENLPPII